LIEAAKKYKFQLKLAGALHGKGDEDWLNNLIEGASNIEYVGMISDDELVSYYRKCKVFALPSLLEGVGMVALEAAGFGAEIVLTNLGAPKEYWQGHATLVDPYSVDDIGKAVLKCMSKDFSKPTMLDFIRDNYSCEACSKKLISALELK
jgi:glycosyltransferase involved in cell wall biosynthesis